MVVALASAHLAENINIGQKVHFDAALSLALAVLAATAGDVEGKTPGFVPALARFRQHGVEVADMGEYSGVGGGIGAWCASNRRLVNAYDFVDVLRAGN